MGQTDTESLLIFVWMFIGEIIPWVARDKNWPYYNLTLEN
jgi:hypothetical protein